MFENRLGVVLTLSLVVLLVSVFLWQHPESTLLRVVGVSQQKAQTSHSFVEECAQFWREGDTKEEGVLLSFLRFALSLEEFHPFRVSSDEKQTIQLQTLKRAYAIAVENGRHAHQRSQGSSFVFLLSNEELLALILNDNIQLAKACYQQHWRNNKRFANDVDPLVQVSERDGIW